MNIESLNPHLKQCSVCSVWSSNWLLSENKLLCAACKTDDDNLQRVKFDCSVVDAKQVRYEFISSAKREKWDKIEQQLVELEQRTIALDRRMDRVDQLLNALECHKEYLKDKPTTS